MSGAPSRGARQRVVIVGAGFGGLYAARSLRSAPVNVTVIDRRNHHLFQPLLYQVATAGLSPGDIAFPIRGVLASQENARVLLGDVVSVVYDTRTVRLADGEVPYDFLIVAAGSADHYFGHAEWASLAPSLRSLEDALEIRRRILLAFERAERETDEMRRRALLSFVIVGGGPTGVELAGAIAEIAFHVMANDFRSIDPREARILLIEAGQRLLPSFPEELSKKAEAELTRVGVEVRTNCSVRSVEKESVLAGDEKIDTATILWAAGVKASPLMQSLGVPLDRAGRVLVEADLSMPGHPEVFVVGDCAAFLHQTGKPLPGVAQVAIQQGKHAAKNIQRRCQGHAPVPFHYHDYGSMATIGRAAAVADFGWIRISGFFAWLTWLLVHIFWLIGFRNRVVVFFEWAWAYFTFQRSARLITGDIRTPRDAPSENTSPPGASAPR